MNKKKPKEKKWKMPPEFGYHITKFDYECAKKLRKAMLSNKNKIKRIKNIDVERVYRENVTTSLELSARDFFQLRTAKKAKNLQIDRVLEWYCGVVSDSAALKKSKLPLIHSGWLFYFEFDRLEMYFERS